MKRHGNRDYRRDTGSWSCYEATNDATTLFLRQDAMLMVWVIDDGKTMLQQKAT